MGKVETNNTSLVAGYAFPRAAINTLVPLSKFCGQSRIEYKGVLQFEQTLVRHRKHSTKVEEKCAGGHQEEP